MAFDPQQRREALQSFMALHGLKVAPWEALSNLGDGTLRKFMDDKTDEKTLTDKTYGKLAAGAQRKIGRPVSIAELQGSVPGPRISLDQPALFDAPPQPPPRGPAPPSPQVQFERPDIPVWASVSAGDGEGSMILTNEPIDYIRRSERTANVPNPWAFHIIGDSMLERLAQGDQVIVNPAMPLLPGSDCVFIHEAGDGMMYGLVKRLLRANSDVWRVRQLHPAKDFELPRRKWSKAYRIAEIRPRM